MKIRIVKGTTKISSKGDIVFHTFGGDMEFNAGQRNLWHGEMGNEVGNYEEMEFSDFPSPVRFECTKVKEYNIGINETRLVRLKVGGKNKNIKRKIKFEKDNNNISLSTSEWEAENVWILETKITGKKYGNTTIKVLVDGLHMNNIKVKCIHYKDVFSEEEVERFINENKNSLLNKTECFIAVDNQFSKVVNDNSIRLRSYANLTGYDRIKDYKTKFYIHSEKRFEQGSTWKRSNEKNYKLVPNSFAVGKENEFSKYIREGIKDKIGYHIYYFALLNGYHILSIIIDNTNPCNPLYKILDQLKDRDWLELLKIDMEFLDMTKRNYERACSRINREDYNSSIHLWKLKRY